MTTNQIKYWEVQENKRAHQAQEKQNLLNYQENVRHSKVSEGIDLSKLTETIRTNQANEAIRRAANEISSMDSLRRLQSSIYAANKSYEASKYASQIQREWYQLQGDLRNMGLALDQQSIDQSARKLDELIRSNKAKEAANYISSIATLLSQALLVKNVRKNNNNDKGNGSDSGSKGNSGATSKSKDVDNILNADEEAYQSWLDEWIKEQTTPKFDLSHLSDGIIYGIPLNVPGILY